MARESLFDGSGYIGFEECLRYEECSKEAYKKVEQMRLMNV